MLPIVVHRASHEPTPEQLKAGNYPKPLRRFAGMRVRVENKAGTVRRGTGPGGVPWETRMLFDYGYVVGSCGTDGDEVDVYLGPHEDAPFAYVIHQRRPQLPDEIQLHQRLAHARRGDAEVAGDVGDTLSFLKHCGGLLSVEEQAAGRGGGRVPAAFERFVDARLADAEVRGNGYDGSALLSHLHSVIQVPESWSTVHAAMVRLLGDDEVRRIVVQSVPVDVVDDFVAREWTPEDFLHDHPMLWSLAALVINQLVLRGSAEGPDVSAAARSHSNHHPWVYDECKAMLGFDSLEDATAAYLQHYDDPRFLGPVTTMPIAEFREKAHASKAAPAMIKSEPRLVLLLKATQKHMVMVSGYTKRDGTYVPPHQRPVHWNPDHSFHDIAHGGVTHSQKEAHKKLAKKAWWQGLSVDDKAIHVMALATDIQDAKSASAAVSGWKAAAMAGKNPSESQWAAFLALNEHKQADLISAVEASAGIAHLNPPKAVGSKAQAAVTSPALHVPKAEPAKVAEIPVASESAKLAPDAASTLQDAPPVPTQGAQDAAGDALADIEATGVYYKKKALAQLKLSPDWAKWDNVTRLEKTNALYKELQGAASASSAFTGWKKKALAGKNPSPSEWNGFLAQSPDKQTAALTDVASTVGSALHLKPPAAAQETTANAQTAAAVAASATNAPAAKPPRKVVVTTKPAEPAKVTAEQVIAAGGHEFKTKKGDVRYYFNGVAKLAGLAATAGFGKVYWSAKDGEFHADYFSDPEVEKKALAAVQAKVAQFSGAAAPAAAPAPAPAAAPAAAAAPDLAAQWAAFGKWAVVPQHLTHAMLEAAGFKLTPHGDKGEDYDYEVKKPGGGTMAGTLYLGGALKQDVESLLAHAKVPLPDLNAINSAYTGGGSSSGASTPAPAQPSAPAADSGPHDGDTKPGANGGILVFKGGHWHKVNSDVLKNTTPGHDKFWTGIVVGHKLVTHYGSNKKILGGATVHEKEFPSHMHAVAALNKLAHEKAAGGYAFSHEVTGVPALSLGIGESIGVGSPAVQHAPAAPAPAAKPSVSDLVAAIEVPMFGKLSDASTTWSKRYAQTAVAAKAAALHKGMDGWTDFITKNPDGSYKVMRPDGIQLNGQLSEHSKHPRQKAMFAFIKKMEAALAGVAPAPAKKKAPPTAPVRQPKVVITSTPAPAAGGGDVMMSADSWPQTGPQGGYNEGGVFKDPAGQEWYLKFPAGGEDVVKNEVLSAALYKAAGCAVPYVTMVKRNGKVGVASLMLPLKKDKDALLAGTAVGLLDGFAVDAWLANWDTVGNNPAAGKGFDNIQFDASGKAVRIDAGGTMNYGGAGGSKTFGDEVIELRTMRDPKKNSHTAQVFGKMTDEQIAASVAKVAALSDTTIRMLVNANGPGSDAGKKALADRLIARRDSMVKQYPAATGGSGSKPKKPFVLKKDELSTPPDFMNWGNSGKPGPATAVEKNVANAEGVKKLYDLAISSNGDIAAIKALQFPVFDKDAAGAWVQVKTTNAEQHPSKWIQGYAQQLINEIEAQRNPPKAFRWDQGHPLAVLDGMHPAVKTAAKHAGTSIGKFLVLGSPGTVSLADLALPEKITYASKKLTTATYSPAAYAAIKKMPSTQRDAVRSYTGSGYQYMNHSLWKGNATGAAKSAAEALHTLGHPIAPGTVLSRKIGVDAATEAMLRKAAGKVLQEPAIMSTSIRPSAWSGNVHMKMHIGPGVKGLWVGKGSEGGGSALSMHGGEDEMILPPNTRLLVLSAKQAGGDDGDGFGPHGSLVMEVVVLPTDEGK